MEPRGSHGTAAFLSLLFALLCIAAFSCSLAAEFNKAQEKEMKVEGTLCNLPRTPVFVLGLAAIVSLSLAQVLDTSLSVARRLRRSKETQKPAIALLAVSWVSFGMASVLLGTGTSMNNGQDYGRGWLDGRCYLVRRGVLASAAVLAVSSAALLIGSIFPAGSLRRRRTAPNESRPPSH